MKFSKILTLAAVTALTLFVAAPGEAADKQKDKAAKAKPYPLKTCIVADDKLDDDAYTFVHEGQEIKICCKSCKEDFDKEPAKYLKKIADADKKK